MSDETSMQAEAPAAQTTTTSADHSPAEHQEHYQEQPANSPEHEHYEEQGHDDHEGEQPDRPKKLNGSQRAKLKQQYLQNALQEREHALQEREQRIAELERFIGERDEHDRQSESERKAEAKRKRIESHLERLNGAKESIADFNRAFRSMEGKQINEDLLEDVLSSDKSELIAYHLASNPDKLDKLNHMPERERVREIGRLEATLKLPEGRKQTKAPPPPSNLKGGRANPNTGPADMNNFAAWLKKDLAARKRR